MTNNGLNVRDDLKHLTVEEIQEIAAADRNPFAVCILNVDGGLNISTIIRSAHNFGAQEVIVFGSTRFDRRGMVGAQNYTEITRIAGLDEDGMLDTEAFFEAMQERLYWPVFVETGGVMLDDFHWNTFVHDGARIPCLVFGNENTGIPIDIITNDMQKFVVTVPQKGVQRSFNVAACASIVMWDLVKEMNWT